jgi:hypothetical protein
VSAGRVEGRDTALIRPLADRRLRDAEDFAAWPSVSQSGSPAGAGRFVAPRRAFTPKIYPKLTDCETFMGLKSDSSTPSLPLVPVTGTAAVGRGCARASVCRPAAIVVERLPQSDPARTPPRRRRRPALPPRPAPPPRRPAAPVLLTGRSRRRGVQRAKAAPATVAVSPARRRRARRPARRGPRGRPRRRRRRAPAA